MGNSQKENDRYRNPLVIFNHGRAVPGKIPPRYLSSFLNADDLSTNASLSQIAADVGPSGYYLDLPVLPSYLHS